jgi:protein-S-isoprenylcysteine O-methyltransferase Ste14
VSPDPGLVSRLTYMISRLRVASGFACGVLVFWLASPTATTILAGVVVAGAGEGFRVWAAGHLNKSREVTRSGPYRLVAHPLYLGSSVIGAGVAIASGSLVAAAIVAAYLLITLTAAIRNEEAFLRRVFGDEYEEYRRAGMAGIAGINDEHRRFSLARAMANREYRAVVGLGVSVLLLVWKATYNGMF